MRSSLVLVPAGIVAGLIGALSTSEPARANCYELIGCSDKDFFNRYRSRCIEQAYFFFYFSNDRWANWIL